MGLIQCGITGCCGNGALDQMKNRIKRCKRQAQVKIPSPKLTDERLVVENVAFHGGGYLLIEDFLQMGADVLASEHTNAH